MMKYSLDKEMNVAADEDNNEKKNEKKLGGDFSFDDLFLSYNEGIPSPSVEKQEEPPTPLNDASTTLPGDEQQEFISNSLPYKSMPIAISTGFPLVHRAHSSPGSPKMFTPAMTIHNAQFSTKRLTQSANNTATMSPNNSPVDGLNSFLRPPKRRGPYL